MDLTMLLLTIATVVLAGGSLWAAVHYGRKALSEAKRANTIAHDANTLAVDTNAMATERSYVKWQAGRQNKDNAGWFYLMNTGQDPAHDVTVLAYTGAEKAEAHADVVAPYSPDDLDAHSPGYVEFRLPERERNGPKPVKGPRLFPPPEGSRFRDDFDESQREMDELIEQQLRKQVAVRVTWRSTLGRWSSYELQTG